ncbi:retropepsin-like aspartic protease family protein [Rubripirellula amarantea]|nr:retropepsin-like aspartic protease [Rubripirellula amarantea]
MIHPRLNRRFTLIPIACAGFACVWFALSVPMPVKALMADETSVTPETPKYSPEVEEKAERILADHGLRRSGKSLQSTKSADISRAVSALGREKRELKLVKKDWEEADHRLRLHRKLARSLTLQDGELNLQLARVAGVDVSANNRIIGLINANRAKQQLVKDEIAALKKNADEKRKTLNEAEAKYAESVLAARASLDQLTAELNKSLSEQDVITAVKVMQVNFDVASDETAGSILNSVERRVLKIEEEVFRESIPLRIEGGALIVDVVVDRKSVPMMVDSGATLVSLPMETATKLGILVPEDAPRLNLIMADGRQISARRVTLEKVRVGNFEAEGVEAAVLDVTATGAEPLLGMSYLGNFKFEIDTAAKTLKMLRISTD